MGRPKRDDTSVRPQDVFATFVAQASSLGNEVDARRRFDDDVTAFLKERNLVEDFEAYRAARKNG